MCHPEQVTAPYGGGKHRRMVEIPIKTTSLRKEETDENYNYKQFVDIFFGSWHFLNFCTSFDP